MKKIEKRIYKLRPGYFLQYEEFIRNHSQFGGGAAEEKYGQGRTFSNVYELYIYAFFTGLQHGVRKDISAQDDLKTFWEIENWKPRELVDCLLACAIAESGLDMNGIEDMEEPEFSSEILKVRRTIEEYANGGLVYLTGLIESDPDLIEDDMLFIGLLSN